MILVHTKALMVTLVVIVSLVVSSGDDTGIDDDACTGTGDIGAGVDISDDTDLFDGGNGSAGMDIGNDTGTCQGTDGDAGGDGLSSSV